jgi:hypothetical protein
MCEGTKVKLDDSHDKFPTSYLGWGHKWLNTE